jgi:hypothetical protein
METIKELKNAGPRAFLSENTDFEVRSLDAESYNKSELQHPFITM